MPAVLHVVFFSIFCSVTNQHFLMFSHMQKMIKRYNLREKVQGQHQTYALGIKEVVFSSLVNLLGYELHTYMCFLISFLQLELEVL